MQRKTARHHGYTPLAATDACEIASVPSLCGLEPGREATAIQAWQGDAYELKASEPLDPGATGRRS
jgi:hypothetical protein